MKNLIIIVFKLIYHCFALLGIAAVLFGLFYSKKLMDDHNLTQEQFVIKVAEKLKLKSELIHSAVAPAHRFDDHQLTGAVKESHPRTVFNSRTQIDTIRERYRNDQTYRKIVDTYTRGAVRWLCAMDFEAGKQGITELLAMELTLPKAEGDYGNGFHIALMYDFLYDHPEWTPDKRARIHSTIKTSIKQALMVLDGGSASLWHGRFQLAGSNWLAAAVFDPGTLEEDRLVARSQGHFLEAIEAITLTEGWPEGYNYWINNRAFYYVMAGISHMNSVDDPRTNAAIQKALETIGLWTLYGTRPDGMFHLFGDSGPRNDLKDETQRIIDLIYLATGNPVFEKYSEYLYGLHGNEGYYRSYRWGIPLFRGLNALDFSKTQKQSNLAFAEGRLGLSRIFGEKQFGQAFIRSGWKDTDTFISFRAGNVFTHHSHYDAGHFTIFKHSPLAISSGSYGDFTSDHRLNYYIRTVSSNSILIVSPDECQRPNKFFSDCVSDCRQRIVIPTGSAITGIQDFNNNLDSGRQYRGGEILIFDNTHPEYVYIKSDLTRAYSDKKAVSVIRELVCLTGPDMLLVHDIVESTRKEYTRKWLLHTWSKPVTSNETLLAGIPTNGILETHDKKSMVTHQQGRLMIETILPENSMTRKIGGPDFKYYVEVDGDDKRLDGKNMIQGANEKPWFDSGLWRMEIQSQDDSPLTEFLVILKPLGSEETPDMNYKKTLHKDATQIDINQMTLVFQKDGRKPFMFSN